MAAPNSNDEARRKAQETASIIEDALRSIAGQIGDIFEQALSGADKTTESVAKDIQSRFNKMAKVTDDIASNIVKLNQGLLGNKDIQDQINKRRSQEIALGIQLTTILKQQGVQAGNIEDIIQGQIDGTIQLTDEQKSLLEEYAKAKEYNEDYIKQLQEQNKEVEKQNKKLGATGGILKGLTKIPVLGNLINAEKGLAAAQQEAAKAESTKASTFAAGMKGMSGAALGFAAIAELIQKIIQFFIDAMFGADKQVTDMAKSFEVSKDLAREYRDEAFEIKTLQEDLGKIQEGNALLQKDIVDNAMKFNEITGMSVNLISQTNRENQKLLVQFANANKYLHLSNEESEGLLNTNIQTGEEIDKIKTSILGQARLYKTLTGYQISERKVLKDVLTTSNAIKLSIKGGTDALVSSVIQAQKLGSSLDEINKAGDSMLDFESSVSAELQAELLLGRDLNLERARYAALTNDTKTLTEEMNRLVAEAGPDFKNNAIAQKFLAEALGISRDRLADMVTSQEKFNKFKQENVKLSEKEIGIVSARFNISEDLRQSLAAGTITGQQFYDKLIAAGGSVEDVTATLGELSAGSLESTDAQQKFAEALEGLKETFTKFVNGGSLDKLASYINSIVNRGFIDTAFGGGAQEEYNKERLEKAGYKVEEGSGLFGTGAFKKTVVYDQAGNVVDSGYGSMGVTDIAGQVLKDKKENKTGTVEIDTKAKNPVAFADGGIINKRIDNATVGEAGPEAIIPLRGPNSFSNLIDYDKLGQAVASAMSKVQLNPIVTLNGKKLTDEVNRTNNVVSQYMQ
jgi:hypothetical protein